jgi:zinc D-Ala-D-Ala carboxypeptidase
MMRSYFPRLKAKKDTLIVVIFIILIAGTIVYGEYQQRLLAQDLREIGEEFSLTTGELVGKIQALEERIALITNENATLGEMLTAEQKKALTFQEQISKVSSTIGTLDKLSKTDPQLLQKYSKVYFLNEHYTPPKLVPINKEYLFAKDRELLVHANVAPYLEKMLSAASKENLPLLVISAYRSFGTQAALKSSYTVIYGAGTANQFSADQGYSEHQLGTTLDFTTSSVGATFNGFEKTENYTWLTQNAHKYGFTLSYPEKNTYYQYEPWHWRFVGVDLATKLHREGKYFYDLDQREIDKYLLVIFD